MVQEKVRFSGQERGPRIESPENQKLKCFPSLLGVCLFLDIAFQVSTPPENLLWFYLEALSKVCPLPRVFVPWWGLSSITFEPCNTTGWFSDAKKI